MKRRNDIILITLLLAGIVALFIMFFVRKESGNQLYVNIYHKEELLYSLPLEKNDKVIVEGDVSEMIIVIKNGRVHVDYSGCDNQICVHEGEKNQEYDVITCLPNRIYIRIGSKLDVNS